MKKGYETPVIEKISLESEEVVCATPDFYTLFGISSGNDNNLKTKAQVFEWGSN